MISGPDNQTPSISNFFKETGTGAYLLAGLSLLSLLFMSDYLMFIPSIVVHSGQVWRLATYAVACPKLLLLVFQTLFIVFWSRSAEKDIGTVCFLHRILKNAVLMALLCVLIQLIGEYALKLNLNRQLMMYSIWPLYFWQISTSCFRSPDSPSRTFFVPVSFPRRYLPFVILLINFMFNQRIAIVDFLPIALGYAEHKRPALFGRLDIGDAATLWLERKLTWLNGIGTFYKKGFAVSTENTIQPARRAMNQSPPAPVERPKLTTGKVKVGGKVLTREERRQAWIKRFGKEGQDPPDNFGEDYEGDIALNDEDISEDFGLITKKNKEDK